MTLNTGSKNERERKGKEDAETPDRRKGSRSDMNSRAGEAEMPGRRPSAGVAQAKRPAEHEPCESLRGEATQEEHAELGRAGGVHHVWLLREDRTELCLPGDEQRRAGSRRERHTAVWRRAGRWERVRWDLKSVRSCQLPCLLPNNWNGFLTAPAHTSVAHFNPFANCNHRFLSKPKCVHLLPLIRQWMPSALRHEDTPAWAFWPRELWLFSNPPEPSITWPTALCSRLPGLLYAPHLLCAQVSPLHGLQQWPFSLLPLPFHLVNFRSQASRLCILKGVFL